MHLVFYKTEAIPVAKATASMHRRKCLASAIPKIERDSKI